MTTFAHPPQVVPSGATVSLHKGRASSLLALGHAHGLATATGGLGVLTTDGETPVVTETTMVAVEATTHTQQSVHIHPIWWKKIAQTHRSSTGL